SYLFDQLVRSRRIRVIATAHHLTGAAAIVSGDPRVTEFAVKRFTREESGRYLQRLLSCEVVEARTLDHWHRITRGSSFSLQLLATAMESGSRLGRHRGVVWEHSVAEGAPEEFGAYLRSVCSDAELEALEFISIAQPLGETSLLRMLEPEVVTSLRRRGLVAAHTLMNRAVVLTAGSPAFREAIVRQTPLQRRREIGARLFDALREETFDGQLRPPAERIRRLVELGLETDRTLPFDWLWQAMEVGGDLDDGTANRRIALAVAGHPEATPLQSGIAALRAAREIRLCGELSHPLEIVELLHEASERLLDASDGSSCEAIAIELELVRALLIDAEDHVRANHRLDALIRRVADRVTDRRDERIAVVEAGRAYALACAGSLKQAAQVCETLTPRSDVLHPTVHAEWARVKARLVASLIRAQQGAYTEA
ncbi:MAG: hypothetical protein J0H64_08485, partial [Actinobacteria bacterium]|nr:hypothetical protein [Actinomycetota bacterium]